MAVSSANLLPELILPVRLRKHKDKEIDLFVPKYYMILKSPTLGVILSTLI